MASATDVQGAEDFRNVKRQRAGGRDKVAEQAAARKRARGIAFGTGAAEETDTYGYMEDYVTADDSRDAGGNFSFEIASDEEDTDVLVARQTSSTSLENPLPSV